MKNVMFETEAYGRMIAAGRMLAGMDQAELAAEAGLSAATVSNVERGNDAKIETRQALRKALRKKGVTANIDPTNGHIFAIATFAQPDEDDV